MYFVHLVNHSPTQVSLHPVYSLGFPYTQFTRLGFPTPSLLTRVSLHPVYSLRFPYTQFKCQQGMEGTDGTAELLYPCLPINPLGITTQPPSLLQIIKPIHCSPTNHTTHPLLSYESYEQAIQPPMNHTTSHCCHYRASH